ncbi:hypothetical protein O3M35_006683 [Rhynocoris fuscipes]|uniref:Uncharacterized protein n=1 Tax=Rhynocoris fuscipes TaxID=488301 RepID=A0AAW1DEC6_9HEMI
MIVIKERRMNEIVRRSSSRRGLILRLGSGFPRVLASVNLSVLNHLRLRESEQEEDDEDSVCLEDDEEVEYGGSSILLYQHLELNFCSRSLSRVLNVKPLILL